MGNTVIALFKHNLDIEEMIFLPEEMSKAEDDTVFQKPNTNWTWSHKEPDEAFLLEYWKRDPLWYTQNKWSQEDLAQITGPKNFSITLFYRHIIILENFFSWMRFYEEEEANLLFIKVAGWLGQILKTNQIIFTDSHSLNFLDETQEPTWDEILQKFRDNNCPIQLFTGPS